MTSPKYVYSNLEEMFGERVKRGLSLYDVASRCEVSVRALTDYESRRTSPNRAIYNRLARVFDWRLWK